MAETHRTYFIQRERSKNTPVSVPEKTAHASLKNAADASSTHFTQPACVTQPYSLAQLHRHEMIHSNIIEITSGISVFHTSLLLNRYKHGEHVLKSL